MKFLRHYCFCCRKVILNLVEMERDGLQLPFSPASLARGDVKINKKVSRVLEQRFTTRSFPIFVTFTRHLFTFTLTPVKGPNRILFFLNLFTSSSLTA